MTDLLASAREIEGAAKDRDLTAAEMAKITAIHIEFDQAQARLESAKREGYLAQPQARLTQGGPSASVNDASLGRVVSPGRPSGTRVSEFSNSAVGKDLAHWARTGTIQNSTTMTIAVPGDGGYEVPEQLDQELARVAANQSAILKVCKVVPNANDAYVANVISTLVQTAWSAESGTRTATTVPGLAQVTFTRGGIYAAVQASNWFLQDGAHDVATWLSEEIGRSIGASVGAALAAGDGVNKPKGITSYAAVATADGARAWGIPQYVPSGTSAVVTLESCLLALMTLHPSYAANAVFVMSLSAALALRQQKASTAGTFLWSPDTAAGTPPTLFGRPVLIDPSMPAVAASSLSIAVGDWQRGFSAIRYGSGGTFLRNPYAVPGMTQFFVEQRWGGGLVDSNAIKFVKAAVS